jgi:hypothetical protein
MLKTMLKTMTACRMPFEFLKEIDPVFIGGNHEFPFTFIAGSLSPPVRALLYSINENCRKVRANPK